jgi:hypothetical protein
MTKLLFLSAAALLLAGCQQPQPERTLAVSNHQYQIDQLFTDPHGVTIYRFWDYGDYRYYAIGPNGVQMIQSPTQHNDSPDASGADSSGDSSSSGKGKK